MSKASFSSSGSSRANRSIIAPHSSYSSHSSRRSHASRRPSDQRANGLSSRDKMSGPKERPVQSQGLHGSDDQAAAISSFLKVKQVRRNRERQVQSARRLGQSTDHQIGDMKSRQMSKNRPQKRRRRANVNQHQRSQPKKRILRIRRPKWVRLWAIRNWFRRPIVIGLACIVYITLVLGIMLNQQAKLIRIGFNNARLQNKIDRLAVVNKQLKGELTKQINWVSVKAQARALGLVDPSDQQIITVELPEEDQLILYGKKAHNNQDDPLHGSGLSSTNDQSDRPVARPRNEIDGSASSELASSNADADVEQPVSDDEQTEDQPASNSSNDETQNGDSKADGVSNQDAQSNEQSSHDQAADLNVASEVVRDESLILKLPQTKETQP